MNLHIKVSLLKKLDAKAFDKVISYRGLDQYVDLPADGFTPKQLDALYDIAKATPDKSLMQRITGYKNIRANPEGQKVGRLEALATALRAYIAPAPNKWLFSTGEDGFAVPYYVRDIKYEPANRRSEQPAYVAVRTAAVTRGDKEGRTLTFHATDLGSTVVEILNDAGFYLETEASVAAYHEEMVLYKEWVGGTGKQYHCVGIGFPAKQYEYGQIAMERDGKPSTVVLDDLTDEEESSSGTAATDVFVSTVFWQKKDATKDEEDEENEGASEGSVMSPLHPYVRVFDLARHHFVHVHVKNLTPYVFDKNVAGKLVLDEATKSLINILIAGSAEVMEDIIQGKTGGTIVISTGPPGTGKTLTAEVFSEEIERPLYVVQCSQLGTNEEKVETTLSLVLSRASRWGAILLIDEADVYVRARGEDIQQNAIVGVFLRVLERYRGVLFLTSNQATVIDDAIMSRATAWIRYEFPNNEQLTAIWDVLSKQYEVPLTPELITSLVGKFPGISGRNVKNLLKLARKLIGKSLGGKTPKPGKDPQEALLRLFEFVSRFLDLRSSNPSMATPKV